MPTPLLTLSKISLNFGSSPLFESCDLNLSSGDRLALVGRNGSGKSTLLKIIAGEIEPDSGKRFIQPRATIRYLSQEPDLSGFKNVLDYVEAGLTAGDDEYRAQYLLNSLGLKGDENPINLSGGEQRRAALAKVLAPNPDILLLDEPTNHLDLPAIIWLQEELNSLKSAMITISHDRRFLSDLTKSCVWIDRGSTNRLNQGFSSFETWRDKYLQEEEEERHKLDRKIVREEHWVRYGVTARRKRNVRRMAELSSLKQDRINQRQQTGSVKLDVAVGKTSGAIIVDAKNISKKYENRTIIDDFSTRIIRGDRVGIIGPNGAGKTTLIKILTDELKPDSGEIKIGTNIELAYLDQSRNSLSDNLSLKDALTGGGSDMVMINNVSRHVISYMKDFLFAPEQAGTKLKKLSGGERARVVLAKALSLPSNFLVLDEPTNDLDLETLDLLQEMVANYDGTVIVVSHDRDFLDRVATSIISFEGNGKLLEYAGGYSDMQSQKKLANKKIPSQEKPRDKKTNSSVSHKKKSKQKLSFNQQHLLKTLPQKIEDLSSSIDKIQTQLDDPHLYTKDAKKFSELSNQLQNLQKELGESENSWLELELLQEKLSN